MGEHSIGIYILFAIIAYLLGSIPSGLIIGKYIFGKDIRNYGSHNIGATNAYRVLGWKGCIPIFLADAIKGIVAAYLFSPDATGMVIGGLLAIIGHTWPVFLKFKGGRGVATGLGILFYFAPVICSICVVLFIIIVYFTRYVSLGSIVGAALTPILMIVFDKPLPFFFYGLIGAAFVIIRHKANIVRLIQGKELKVGRTERDS